MKEISLSRGLVALVDDEDYEWLSKKKWHADDRSYACSWSPRSEGRQSKIRMHREIIEPMPRQHVDHINGNTLDNRRSNLRACTRSENQRNRRTTKRNTSGFKGVHWCRFNRKWKAQIQHQGHKISLGYFSTAQEAAESYDQKAKELHGEFAKTNKEIK